VAQQVIESVHRSRPYGATELFEAVIGSARKDAAEAERARSRRRSASTRRQLTPVTQAFALRLGTSRSRLSTYMSGRVIPSATLMIRMRHAAAQAHNVR
jgi:hypothetical protein